MNLSKRQLRGLVLCSILSFAVPCGRAWGDTIRVFNAAGTLQDGATLSGTLTIDVTTGLATAVDIVVTSPDSLTFDFIQAQAGNTPVVGQYEMSLLIQRSRLLQFQVSEAAVSVKVFWSGLSGGTGCWGAIGQKTGIRPDGTFRAFCRLRPTLRFVLSGA